MSLANGTRLGPYEITGTLGAGGMGEVYRGKDTRLGRDVAVKVLPEQISSDPDALARFEREARAVAALSHPNILAIHDIGVEGGRAYAITELLEGETLRRRLDGTALPVRKALDYAGQIALGLAAAHENGVVHRDLKPENIIITHDGRVKILDFGLAKLEGPVAADGATATPTVDVGTRPGTIMGTMGYMSPEQVRGSAVDARSDLFSFGAVLYEMLTGSKAFSRETPADTMSAILTVDPPPLADSGAEFPPALQMIIDHCLEKKAAERFQSARDLAFHLDAVGNVSSSAALEGLPAKTGTGAGLRGVLLLLAGIVLGAVAGATAATRLRAPETLEPPSIRYLSYSGRDAEPAASPDGRLIAYSSVHGGRSQIWLKQFPGGDEVALTEGPDDRSPRISPDGSQLLFTRVQGARTSVYKLPLVGGEPRKVAVNARTADWSPGGDRVVFLRGRLEDGSLNISVWTVDATGHGERELTSTNLASLNNPRWSPDGKTIAVVKGGTENAPNVILLIPVDGGEVKTLTPPPPRGRLSAPVWVGGGESILYAQSSSFASVSGDQGSGRVTLHDIATDSTRVKMWLPSPTDGLDILEAGSVVLGVSSQSQNLAEVRLSPDGSTVLASSRPRWLTRGNSVDRQPVFSPDGRWILFSSNRGGNLDLWKMEVESGAIRRITEDQADDWDPAFTPDGEHIVWSSNRSGRFEIWICSTDGTGARQLTDDGFDAENPTATPDGQWVVYNSANPSAPGIWKVHQDGTGAELVVPGSWSTPDVSPDGKYVAFRLGAEPRTLHVVRLEDGALVIPPLNLPGGMNNGRPRWTPDGKSLLYTASDETGARGIYIQEIIPGQDTTSTRRRVMEFVFEAPPESHGISPDGSRLIYSVLDSLDSLMLARGLGGVTPPGRSGR